MDFDPRGRHGALCGHPLDGNLCLDGEAAAPQDHRVAHHSRRGRDALHRLQLHDVGKLAGLASLEQSWLLERALCG